MAFIRVGEKLLQRFAPRPPMIRGSLIVGAAIACLLPTNLTLGSYKVLAAVGFTLFRLGLITYHGRQDNVAMREAAFAALAVNLLMVAAAVVSIMVTIPGRSATTPTAAQAHET